MPEVPPTPNSRPANQNITRAGDGNKFARDSFKPINYKTGNASYLQSKAVILNGLQEGQSIKWDGKKFVPASFVPSSLGTQRILYVDTRMEDNEQTDNTFNRVQKAIDKLVVTLFVLTRNVRLFLKATLPLNR